MQNKIVAYRRDLSGRFAPSPLKHIAVNACMLFAVVGTLYSGFAGKRAMAAYLASQVPPPVETQDSPSWMHVMGGEAKPCDRLSESEWICYGSDVSHPAKPAPQVIVERPVTPISISPKYWELAKKICGEQKQDAIECPRYLLAVATVESIFGQRMIGDGGKSQGWFHINDIHNAKVSLECKMDFYCAGSWSLKRMIGNGYGNPKTRLWAVASHNSVTPHVNARYQDMVKAALKKIE